MSTVIQSVAPVVSPTFTGTLTSGRIVATSTTEEHQLYANFNHSGYTTSGVLLLNHSDGSGGSAAIRCHGPGTSNEFTAFGCGGSGFAGGIYDATFIEGSDEQGQGSGKPIVIIQRSTLGTTKAYDSALRFKIAPTAGGPMTFFNSTGAAQVLGITDGAVEIGTTASATGQLRVAGDAGYTTGGVLFRDGSAGKAGLIFGNLTGAFYIQGGTAHGTGFVNAAGSTVVAYMTDAGAVQVSGLKVGGTAGASGTNVDLIVSATATLNFPSTNAGAVSDLTITVTGAADGDPVILGVPNGSMPASGTFSAWVSAADTVTVRYENNDLISARDPASGTFRATVISH